MNYFPHRQPGAISKLSQHNSGWTHYISRLGIAFNNVLCSFFQNYISSSQITYFSSIILSIAPFFVLIILNILIYSRTKARCSLLAATTSRWTPDPGLGPLFSINSCGSATSIFSPPPSGSGGSSSSPASWSWSSSSTLPATACGCWSTFPSWSQCSQKLTSGAPSWPSQPLSPTSSSRPTAPAMQLFIALRCENSAIMKAK